MKQFLNWNFWFSLRPGESTIISVLVVLLILMVVATAVFYVLRRRDRSVNRLLWIKLNSFFMANAIIALFKLFFDFEMLVFLSARFWFLVWGAEMLVWAYFIVSFAMKLPAMKAEQVKKQEYNKYIP